MPVAGDTANERAVHGPGTQAEYKRALVELLAEVMHPPDFTQVTARYAWCIHVNKLLRELKSVTTKLDPADLPRSFVDVDEFVSEAWRLAVADEILDFYEKWPRDLDRQVEESFTSGVPLGRMMAESSRSRSAAGSAAGPRPGPASPNTTPARSREDTSYTPNSTPSSDSRVYSTRSSYLPNSETGLPLSPTRRFSMADFKRLVTDKSKADCNASRPHPRPQPLTPSTSSSPIAPRASAPSSDNWPAAPTSLTPERSMSLRRSASARPWIPQSYRDGSMPADLAELFSMLDEVCQAADTLVTEAEDIDANDEGEMRLKEWTSRARKCEMNGRKALARVASAGIAKTDEVLYVASTLNLLKSAHIELIEYAESMLNPASSAPREAATALQPAIRDSESLDSTGSVTRETPVEAEREHPGPPRSSTQRRLSPYVLLPSVPWRWFPTDQEPDPSKSSLLTSDIVIRTTRAGTGSRCTLRLQRMTDRVPGDEQHDPPCSECAERGFSCFGRPGVRHSCRRCGRVRRGHCTYARPRAAHAAKTAKGKGKGKEMETEKEDGKRKGMGWGKEEVIEKETEKGKKRLRLRPRPRPSLETLRKLRSAEVKKELQKESDQESEIETESESEDVDVDVAPPAKRRRSASPRATHEPEPEPHLPFPARATSEPLDRASRARSRSRRPRLASLARSSRQSTLARSNEASLDDLFGPAPHGPERASSEARGIQPQPEPPHAPEPESAPEPEPEETSTTPAAVPTSALIPVSAPVPALVSTPAPAPVPASILTPTSLASPMPMPSPNHDLSPNPLLVAALTAKLDTLTASQAALTAELRGTQAKLALQVRVIAEVREALRVLTASTGLDLDLEDGKDDNAELDEDGSLED